MSLRKTLIAFSLLFMITAVFAGEPVDASCKKLEQGPPGPQGSAGPQGPPGVNAPTALLWSQSLFDEGNSTFTVGDAIPFNGFSIESGITYVVPGFVLTAGTYEVSFEGYVSQQGDGDIGNAGNIGVQFFLNGTTPIGTAYLPIPNTISFFDPPFTLVAQAIFEAAAGDVLTVEVVGTTDDTLTFDTLGGGASASIKIVKLAN